MRPLRPYLDSGASAHSKQPATCVLLPLLARERVESLKRQLFRLFIPAELIPDVFLDLLCVLSGRIDIVSPAPEPSVSVPELHVPVLLVDHQGALALQVSHKGRNRQLRRDRDQKVHVIRTQLSLKQFHPLLEAQLLHDVPHIAPYLPIEHPPSVFRGKDEVIPAVPGRMRQCITLFNHSTI